MLITESVFDQDKKLYVFFLMLSPQRLTHEELELGVT